MLARLQVHHRSKHFQFETRCDSNHTDCCFVEKPRFFSAYSGPGGTAPPPRVLPFSKAKRSISPGQQPPQIRLALPGIRFPDSPAAGSRGSSTPTTACHPCGQEPVPLSYTCGNNIFPVSAPPDLITKVPASQRPPQTCCLRERQLSRKAALPAQGNFFRLPHRYFQDYAAPCHAAKEKQWIRLVTKFSAGNFHAFTTFYERESALT